MPLFACRNCNCVENTACSQYWNDVMDNKPTLCSECHPDTGSWHNRFPKRSAIGMLVDNQGHLWTSSSLPGLPKHLSIIGLI